MKQNKTSAQLKAIARGNIQGRYRTLIPIMIFVQLFAMFLSLTSPVTTLDTIPGIILYSSGIFFSILFLSLFRVGEVYIFLNLACGRNIRFMDIFHGLYACPWKIIGIQAILSLIHGVLMSVPALASAAVLVQENTALLPVMIISAVICIPADIFISLQYSQAFFVMLDFPEFSVRQCLRFSRKIMKGHKSRKLYIELSFLPLNIAALFSCCIGSLFLEPYIYATNTNFYLDLMQNRRQNP